MLGFLNHVRCDKSKSVAQITTVFKSFYSPDEKGEFKDKTYFMKLYLPQICENELLKCAYLS